MIIAVLIVTSLGLGIGLILGFSAKLFAVEDENPLIKEIESLLPASQCGQCGFPGCSSAAKAIVEGEAEVNCCPPGGRALTEKLAGIMGVDMDTIGEIAEPQVAAINEELCTGCTKCFKACPTDAVVGANGQIHVVLQSACTGCKKCMEACPESCISMEHEPVTLENWQWSKPEAA